MSLSTAVIVNAALAATVLGALAIVCRLPFRLSGNQPGLGAPSQDLEAELEQRAA
jgi:hypothetical protein